MTWFACAIALFERLSVAFPWKPMLSVFVVV